MSDRDTLERAELRMNSAVRCVAAAVNSRMGVRVGTGTGPRDVDRTYALTITDNDNRLNPFRCKGDYCRVRTSSSGRAGDDSSSDSSSSIERCDIRSGLPVNDGDYFKPAGYAMLQPHQITINSDRPASSRTAAYAPHDYDMISMRSIRLARKERRSHEDKTNKDKLTAQDGGREEIGNHSKVSLSTVRSSQVELFPKDSRMFVKNEVSH